MAQLTNRADFSGQYDTMQVTDFTQAVVELNAVELTKAANKQIWLDDGSDLLYTITARNVDDRDPDAAQNPGLPLTGVTIIDNIDTAIVTLQEESLTLSIGGEEVDPVVYTYVDGVLTVQVGTIPAGASAVLTFLVERVS